MDKKEFRQLLSEYDRSNMTVPFDGSGVLRHPVTCSELKHVVKDDGIYEEQFEYDQFGEVFVEYSHKVMSKDAFKEAYKKYIEENK